MARPRQISTGKVGIESGSAAFQADALTTRPTRRSNERHLTCCHTTIEAADQCVISNSHIKLTVDQSELGHSRVATTLHCSSRNLLPLQYLIPQAPDRMATIAPYSITNEEMKARIGNAIGPYEDLLTAVKRRKLKWYGHVTRSSGLAKTILQGTVQGGRR